MEGCPRRHGVSEGGIANCNCRGSWAYLTFNNALWRSFWMTQITSSPHEN